ncbi:hypothetical protein [Clostridium estertheticum]|uniref:hypothetical protein n=1 Tax=Clostridium estertheticum TaxID=238834 RepID=UPI001C6E2F71|nr:hypothetical protein [Clostridium estertheticum]MBW9152854.1 hypothetical protein [Clostridium estertheticum]WLC85810.1 hypothetical protein KTC97_08725 [Clostridium estertheticum]
MVYECEYIYGHLNDVNSEKELEDFYEIKSPAELKIIYNAISKYKGNNDTKRIDIANIRVVFDTNKVSDNLGIIKDVTDLCKLPYFEELEKIFGKLVFRENSSIKEYYTDIMIIADEEKPKRPSAKVVKFGDNSEIDFHEIKYNSFNEFKTLLRNCNFVKEINIDVSADYTIKLKDKNVSTITLLDTEGVNDSSSRGIATNEDGDQIGIQDTNSRIKTYVEMFGDKINGVVYCIPWGNAGSRSNIFDDINCCISHLIAKPIYLVVTKVDLDLEELAKTYCNVDNLDEYALEEDTDELLKVVDYLYDAQQVVFKERLSSKLTDSTDFELALNDKVAGLNHIYTQSVLTTSLNKIYRHLNKDSTRSKDFINVLNNLIKAKEYTSLDELGQQQFVEMLNDYADFVSIKPLTDIQSLITGTAFTTYIQDLLKNIFDYAHNGCSAIHTNKKLVFAALKAYDTKYDEAISNDFGLGSVSTAIERRLTNKMLGYKGTTCNLSFKKQLLEALPRALNTTCVPTELRPHINTIVMNVNIFFERIFTCSGCNQCIQGATLHKRCIKDCKRTKLYKLSALKYDATTDKVMGKLNKNCDTCSYASSNYDMLNFGFCVEDKENSWQGRDYCIWDILKTYNRTSFRGIFDLNDSYYGGYPIVLNKLTNIFVDIIKKSL